MRGQSIFKQRNLGDKTVSTALIVMIALCVLGMGTRAEDSRVELEIDKDRVFYGQLPYGLYSIRMESLKTIIIKGLTKQER